MADTTKEEEVYRRRSWNTALIDGDIIVYRVGFAAQTTFYDVYYRPEGEDWGPVRSFNNKTDLNAFMEEQGDEKEEFYWNKRIVADDIAAALHSVKLQVQSILKGTNAKNYKLFLTGKGNYRDKIVYYKANRNRSDRPIHYDAIREYLIKHWNAKVVNNREADDALSITQWRDYTQASETYEERDGEEFRNSLLTIICSIDKDLKMVPGWHYNFVTKEFVYQSKEGGLRWFYTQMLQGDVADNIPGLHKLSGQRVSNWARMLKPLASMTTDKEMYAFVHALFWAAFDELNDGTYSDEELSNAIDKTLTETGQLLWMQKTKEDVWTSTNIK